ncbi:MAG TPA: hypothetical protein VMV29_17790, partial [Ktedonobacterales bacterium]|nr:hypothetical protein [Ktedonobacterales bacterium]
IIDRWVGEAPPLDRSFMYRRIGRFLLYRRWPSEPIASRPKQLVDVTYATLLKVCTLLERIEEDSLLVGLMSDIADCIVQGRAQNRHLREYQAEVAKRLREIGQARLPQATNITHEGYKIMAQAQAVRCDPFQHGQASAWLPLAEAARAIPNTADRAFVLGYLASMTPVVAQRNAWFAEAEVAAQGIAGRIDRADHFEGLANLALDHIGGESGQSLARSYVEKATVTLLGAREDPSSHAMLQRLVDMAYQIDQDWAATLATQADDDPARLAQRAKGAALRNQMLGRDAVSSESGQQARRATGPVAVGTTGAAIMHATPRGGDEPREAQEDQEVGEYVEVALALLSSLNAGRVPTKHFEETRRFLWVASQSPLSDAYPIYAWILENAAVRFRFQRPNAAVDSSLRVLFEATVNATELAGKLIAYTSQRALESARYSAYYTTDQAPSSETGIRLIRTGEHEAAVEYIRAWLMAHAVDYLLLIDPYFSRQDLEWLNLMAEACPGLPVNILTGARAQHQEQLEGTLDELYQAHWRQAVSDQAPPPTQVTVVGIGKGGPAPFHDRWLLTHGAGLEVGGSFNGLGAKDLIQLTPVSAEDAARVEQMYQQYLLGRAWLSDGQRLYYMMFHL